MTGLGKSFTGKAEFQPRSAALDADALTTRPSRLAPLDLTDVCQNGSKAAAPGFTPAGFLAHVTDGAPFVLGPFV